MPITNSKLPPLYRGLTAPLKTDAEHAYIRTDRRPRNTSLAFNICFNLMIERKFGVSGVRRKSLFVSGDIRRAVPYAKEEDEYHLCSIQPLGEFCYLYSPIVHDSYCLEDEFSSRYFACFYPWNTGDHFADHFASPNLTIGELAAVFLEHPEVDRPENAWSPSSLRERLSGALDNLAEKYDYRMNEGLASAAASGVEIMLFDCPEGYRQHRVNKTILLPLSAHRSEPLPSNPLLPEQDPIPKRLFKTIVIDIALGVGNEECLMFFSTLTERLLGAGARVEILVPHSMGSLSEARGILIKHGISFSEIFQYEDSRAYSPKKRIKRLDQQDWIFERKAHAVAARIASVFISDDVAAIGYHGNFSLGFLCVNAADQKSVLTWINAAMFSDA